MALIVTPVIETSRLLTRQLQISDARFILTLLNTEGWLEFIGNRHISSIAESKAYIEKVLDNSNLLYYVVELKNSGSKIGVVTFIKRRYLPNNDIGFAFLPQYWNKGYGYEATQSVLLYLMNKEKLDHVHATTVPRNTRCIRLLKRLGFVLERNIEIEKEQLQLYGIHQSQAPELDVR